MNKKNIVVAIIPARGGSKGIKKKNIALLAGKPLVVYAIEVGLSSSLIDEVYVSTDDAEIAQISIDNGAKVIDRPAELAEDSTPDYPVFSHAISWLKQKGVEPTLLVNLRPTCPLRTVEDVNHAIQKMIDSNCDAVRSVTPVEHHPYWMMRMDKDRLTSFIEGIDIKKYYQRQLLPPAYRLNGGVDVMKVSVIENQHQLYGSDICGVLMPVERSIDIDAPHDLKLAEEILRQRK